MRAVVQCVSSARVVASDTQLPISQIGPGLLALIGISRSDTAADRAWLVRKLATARLFAHPERPQQLWMADLPTVQGQILCVSQFTLMADVVRLPVSDWGEFC